MTLEILLEPLPQRGPKPCKISDILSELDPKYRTALANLLDTPWKSGGLSDLELQHRMNAAGLQASKNTINSHRKGLCGCSKAKK